MNTQQVTEGYQEDASFGDTEYLMATKEKGKQNWLRQMQMQAAAPFTQSPWPVLTLMCL